MAAAAWVFGYGSLVSPASAARTTGRTVRPGIDAAPAALTGYRRRWNYGSLARRGSWQLGGVRVHGVVVALGLEEDTEASCCGLVLRVTDAELARLDRREADYDRTDVTRSVVVDPGVFVDGPVVTYVPRPVAVERYLRARDEGRAAIRRDYWDLVHGAFDALGPGHLDRFVSTTPAPDVPVADVEFDVPPDR